MYTPYYYTVNESLHNMFMSNLVGDLVVDMLLFFVVDINECDSYPCLNGGSCTDGVDLFSCVCAPGITGLTCDTVISMFY